MDGMRDTADREGASVLCYKTRTRRKNVKGRTLKCPFCLGLDSLR